MSLNIKPQTFKTVKDLKIKDLVYGIENNFKDVIPLYITKITEYPNASRAITITDKKQTETILTSEEANVIISDRLDYVIYVDKLQLLMRLEFEKQNIDTLIEKLRIIIK